MDAIRAVAAFLVLAGHARSLLFGEHAAQATAVVAAAPLQNAAAPVRSLGLGHHAVIVFFVLSGFLIGDSAWRAIRSGRWSWTNYLLQRMTRLWIVLIPALLIGACIDHVGMHFLMRNHSIYTGPPGQGMVDQRLPGSSTVTVLAGNALFLQMIRVPTYGTNAALWSLANEFWYYMAFPPLLLLFFGKRPLWVRAGYGLLVAAILTFVGGDIAALFVVWLLGYVVSLLPLWIAEPYRRPVTLVCLLQFVAVNTVLRIYPVAAVMADGLLGLSFALFLYAVVHARQPIRSFVYERLATRFSSFSYTLYLVHLPFLTLLTALLMRPWTPWPRNPQHLVEAVLLVVAAYAYAWVLYLLFERNTSRLRLWMKPFFDRQPALPATPR